MNTHLLLEEERTYDEPSRTRMDEIPVPLNLFSDCLLETTGAQRKRRGWSVVFSISFQAVILGILILMPLMFTEVLPTKQLLTFLVAPPPPPPPPRPPLPHGRRVSAPISSRGNCSHRLRSHSRSRWFTRKKSNLPAE